MNDIFLTQLRAMLPPGPEPDGALLCLLLKRAENTILDCIGRETLPERLFDCVPYLALIMYNRLGTEGESRRREGEADMSYIDGLPDDVRERLKNYPRKVGAVCAADKEQAEKG